VSVVSPTTMRPPISLWAKGKWKFLAWRPKES
jgi:hypothetical protein